MGLIESPRRVAMALLAFGSLLFALGLALVSIPGALVVGGLVLVVVALEELR